jgi:hypothetical protein
VGYKHDEMGKTSNTHGDLKYTFFIVKYGRQATLTSQILIVG